MNVGGLLEDGTAAFASASDVPGDQGFLTLHVYHNRGGTVGGSDLVLREEREAASGPAGSASSG